MMKVNLWTLCLLFYLVDYSSTFNLFKLYQDLLQPGGYGEVRQVPCSLQSAVTSTNLEALLRTKIKNPQCFVPVRDLAPTMDELIGKDNGIAAYPHGQGGCDGKLIDQDMCLTPQQAKLMKQPKKGFKSGGHSLVKRKALTSPSSLWPKGEIPFHIKPGSFSVDEVRTIVSAMSEWEQATCIQFRQATPDDVDKLEIVNGHGCYSRVGRTGGTQKLTLGTGSCRTYKVVLHEIGHALGLIHEHQRADRDSHVTINYSNVKPIFKDQFSIIEPQVAEPIVAYDYMSLMHYGKSFFSVDGTSTTIQAHDEQYQDVIGRVKKLSFLDIKAINILYKCADHCPKTVQCTGDGYVGPSCKCICPDSAGSCETISPDTLPAPISELIQNILSKQSSFRDPPPEVLVGWDVSAAPSVEPLQSLGTTTPGNTTTPPSATKEVTSLVYNYPNKPVEVTPTPAERVSTNDTTMNITETTTLVPLARYPSGPSAGTPGQRIVIVKQQPGTNLGGILKKLLNSEAGVVRTVNFGDTRKQALINSRHHNSSTLSTPGLVSRTLSQLLTPDSANIPTQRRTSVNANFAFPRGKQQMPYQSRAFRTSSVNQPAKQFEITNSVRENESKSLAQIISRLAILSGLDITKISVVKPVSKNNRLSYRQTVDPRNRIVRLVNPGDSRPSLPSQPNPAQPPSEGRTVVLKINLPHVASEKERQAVNSRLIDAISRSLKPDNTLQGTIGQKTRGQKWPNARSVPASSSFGSSRSQQTVTQYGQTQSSLQDLVSRSNNRLLQGGIVSPISYQARVQEYLRQLQLAGWGRHPYLDVVPSSNGVSSYEGSGTSRKAIVEGFLDGQLGVQGYGQNSDNLVASSQSRSKGVPCSDRVASCPAFADVASCRQSAFVREYCPRSCRVC